MTAAASWTAPALARLSREAALHLFATLAPPTDTEMNREFVGHVPNYMAAEWHNFVAESGIGQWLGKAYCSEPCGAWPGHGYNIYRKDDRMIRRLRFAWGFGSSVLDGRPALIMHYPAFSNWAGENGLIDEIRKAGDGVMLGLYYTRAPVPGFTPRGGNGRTEPEIFILTGPVAPWSGADRD